MARHNTTQNNIKTPQQHMTESTLDCRYKIEAQLGMLKFRYDMIWIQFFDSVRALNALDQGSQATGG